MTGELDLLTRALVAYVAWTWGQLARMAWEHRGRIRWPGADWRDMRRFNRWLDSLPPGDRYVVVGRLRALAKAGGGAGMTTHDVMVSLPSGASFSVRAHDEREPTP